MSTIHSRVVQRFAELEAQGRAIRLVGQGGQGSTPHAQPEQFYAWSTSALNAIQGVFGKDSPHCQRFELEMESITNNYVWERKLEAFRGMFLGAKHDVDGGHMFSLQASFSGEIFGDFVATAKAALLEGQHTVAAVLACAALEDALKRFAASNGLPVDGQTMEDVVNALKSKGLVSGAQKTLLAAMPKIRNQAMHAEWSKITPQDVGSVIGYVEQFLLSHFS
jgi:hypothetical protein